MPSVLSHIFFTISYAQIEETLQQESFFLFCWAAGGGR